jgi:pyridoxine 5-phosphate synthase
MVRLSVNVNKVATLRNSRGGALPSVVDAVRVCIDAGAPGITVHPRADERHIRRRDVPEVAAALASHPGVEFNIEGDPRPDLLAMVRDVRPHQCTLVPVMPGEITSQAGWPSSTPVETLRGVVAGLRADGVRVSLFIEPEEAAVRWAASIGADRIELYTEPRTLPHLDEVSIGHALISHALYVGLDRAVRDYLLACRGRA